MFTGFDKLTQMKIWVGQWRYRKTTHVASKNKTDLNARKRRK